MNRPLLMERNAGRALRSSSRHKSDWARFFVHIVVVACKLTLGDTRAWLRGCCNACFDWSNFHNAGGTKTDILSATRNKRIPLRKRKAKWEFNCPLCNIRSKNNQAGGCGTPKKFGAYVCSFMKYWWVHNPGLVAWLCLVWLEWIDAQAKIKFCIAVNFSSLLYMFFLIVGE